jgi:hypothetical protein
MGEETIHHAIEASAEHNEKLEGALLVGWVVVAEWVGVDGTRSLVRMAGTPGEMVPPIWQTKGYLHESLYGNWES